MSLFDSGGELKAMHWRRSNRSLVLVCLWGAWALACGESKPAASSGDASACEGSGCSAVGAAGSGGAAGTSGRSGSGGGLDRTDAAPADVAAAGAGASPAVAGAGAAGTPAAAGSSAPPIAAAGMDAGPEASDAAANGGSCGACETYAAPTLLANSQVAELDALSGAAVSRKYPELIFAHNDHNRPVVYALDMHGALRARLTLQNAPATDIEDIAIGPCPGGSCVYLADIGDNAAARSDYALLRFSEPEIPATGAAAQLSPSFERLRFTYEDGSHNAESLIVEPGSGRLYIVTKEAAGQPSRVYHIEEPSAAGAMRRAIKVADLSVPEPGGSPITAGAAQPCGLGFVLRSNDAVYEYRVAPGSAFELAFAAAPRAIGSAPEPQSEGIDYLADGRGLLSSGEGVKAPIYVTRCE